MTSFIVKDKGWMIMKPANVLVAVLVLTFGLFANHPLTQPAGVPPKTDQGDGSSRPSSS